MGKTTTQIGLRILKALFPPETAHTGSLSQGDQGVIDDGVDYSLPPVVPYRDPVRSPEKGPSEEAGGRSSYRFQFDQPMRDRSDEPVFMATEDPLSEWDWYTRERILTNCHSAYQRNPIAHRALKYSGQFVVGRGFQISYQNSEVRELLERFINDPDNAIRQLEAQVPIDLLLDGEVFLRFYSDMNVPAPASAVVVVPLKPWNIQWIKTEEGFFRRPTSYMYWRNRIQGDFPGGNHGEQPEEIPANEVLHVAVNRHSYELRGRPELYPILPWLRAYKEWLENRARQNFWRNALLWVVNLATNNPSVIQSKQAQYSRPPTPGSIVVASDRETWTATSGATGGSDAAEDGRQIKLMSAVGMGLAEYFLSDGSNANLASATAQQVPSLMTFSALQTVLIEQLWIPLFKRVLMAYIQGGMISDRVSIDLVDEEDEELGLTSELGEINALQAFDVRYSDASDMNLLQLAQSLAIAGDRNWLSDETIVSELGFDPAQERRQLTLESKRTQAKIQAGWIPAPPEFQPPGLGGNADDGSEGA